ncbi:MAG: malonyl-ACP O-methyltransferase BioC [Betaproteobacteria bacterium]|nr:malonyl-ACP O-methyltransferase BioC [Betaproteobacteria bacterium]
MGTESLIDKRQMRRSFEHAAGNYDRAAVLQREVCDRMASRLDYIKIAPRAILDAGSGTGYGGRALAARYPDAAVVELDIALGMLAQGRSAHPWWKRLLPIPRATPPAICADVEALPVKAASIDLVWSNLTLQWCNDLPRVFAEMHRVLKVGGLLMFSTFGPDTLKELRQAFDGVDRYTHVNRFVDMHDIGDMLVAGGLADPVMDMEFITVTYPDVKALMHDLKAIGAHNITAGRRRGLTGKSAWRKALARYEMLRREGRLPATFEVVYGHAWKVQPRKTADGREVVRFAPRRA